MCAVYRPSIDADWAKQKLGVDLPLVGQDVYPGQLGPILVQSRRDGRRGVGLARFGLIAPWAKDTKFGRHTYNARSETVATKPSFRHAWRAQQFAVVLVDHFFEPCYETGRAVRWQIRTTSREPFGIAGLWQRWVDPQSAEMVVSFTMLTINADLHPVMRRFHRPADEKRTPVVLPAHLFDAWLAATHETAPSFLDLAILPELVSKPVSD
jgi:putative SOS response-associated peptidase YedK